MAGRFGCGKDLGSYLEELNQWDGTKVWEATV